MTTYGFDPTTGKRLMRSGIAMSALSPMTQAEMDRQCDLVSQAAEQDPGEGEEHMVLLKPLSEYEKGTVPPGHKDNLETIIRAAGHHALAVITARDLTNGGICTLLVAVARGAGGLFEVTPLARLFDEDPYQRYSLDI